MGGVQNPPLEIEIYIEKKFRPLMKIENIREKNLDPPPNDLAPLEKFLTGMLECWIFLGRLNGLMKIF